MEEDTNLRKIGSCSEIVLQRSQENLFSFVIYSLCWATQNSFCQKPGRWIPFIHSESKTRKSIVRLNQIFWKNLGCPTTLTLSISLTCVQLALSSCPLCERPSPSVGLSAMRSDFALAGWWSAEHLVITSPSLILMSGWAVSWGNLHGVTINR